MDTTAYIVKKRDPALILEEAKASGCKRYCLAALKAVELSIHKRLVGVQAGGIYVNQTALWELRTLFGQIQIPRAVLEEWLKHADDDFENNVKPEFPRTSGRYSIAVDRASYRNDQIGIKNGRLQLLA